MKKPAITEVITPAVVSYVRAYLMARAYAETMTERVDAVYRSILQECPVYADRVGCNGERITESKRLFLATDTARVADCHAEANKRLRAAKIKPADMLDDYCPALVAQDLQRKTERLLVDEAGKPFGITADKLLCAGLDAWKEFIKLTVSLVVSQPGFKCELRPS